MPFAGGEARTLYESPGEISEVVKAGEHVVFVNVAPPTPEQLAEQAQKKAAKKIASRPRGPSVLMSVPAAGGEAKRLARLGGFMSGVVLGADGPNVYLSGYLDEDLAKPGLFRVDASGARALESLDKRVVSGSAFVSGSDVVIVGSGMVEAGKSVFGPLVLTVPRNGKSVAQPACVGGGHTLHASAVTNKTALLALMKTDSRLASIAKFTLP